MLSERLQALVLAGAVARNEGTGGPEYLLTEAGKELADVVGTLATWGQRWLPRHAEDEDLDLDPLLVDMQRRVRSAKLPAEPIVVRFEIDTYRPRFMLLKASEASLCTHNPGFPEPVCVRARLSAMAAWWRGDIGFVEAQRRGLSVNGPRALVRAFPDWFDRYLFAHVAPVSASARASAAVRISYPTNARR